MERRRKRRGRSKSKGRNDETELTPLVKTQVSQSYTSIPEDQDQEQDQSDETLTDEVGWSTDSTEKLRFIVLGGDDALMDKACGTILRKRKKRNAFHFGKLEPRNAYVCGRQVSVLKTPFRWLEHLKSYLFFSRGVKSIRNEMESYESLLFPGPHAFLLVHRDVKNSGRDYYLLRALSDVFGEEVLDYCMVLFMDRAMHNNPKKNTCLKMCENRHYILQNTDTSVNEMFKKVKIMTENKDNNFFTPHLEFFRKASNYFQVEYSEKENKLRKALIDSKDRESQLEREIEKLQREVELLKDNEKQLQKNLTGAIGKEDCLHERERELYKTVKELDDRQRYLHEREKELEIRDREREVTQRDVRSRELHQTTAVAPSAVSGDRDSPLGECEGGIRDDSQASKLLRIQKPVRRNSRELNPPYM
ncbi:uncharacterized protein LOC131528879 isoform X2 [Onychostoma macrolepis]|uniref:AIG1-type G domain-containing protein n=1 Tax=Onychostoma macrolepis TaxID=369639 RepID=A0A7J6BVF2_9TELE|nr:uncharacterized protein LOC131528879 isoform X2 [Onychostoma macrolepis]XP_058614307.1 uncharacterized protein LOC131528879 isoform X2 [Onychostoma macrolepis]KAF4098967.1 hypothetical protein G5714_020997 [Onychostoma macrolepis]